MKCPSFVSRNPIQFWQRDKEEHHGFPFLAGSAKTVWQLARAPGAPNTAFLSTKGAAAADATAEWSPDPQSREQTALPTRVHHSLTEVTDKGSSVLSLFGEREEDKQRNSWSHQFTSQASSLFHFHSLLFVPSAFSFLPSLGSAAHGRKGLLGLSYTLLVRVPKAGEVLFSPVPIAFSGKWPRFPDWFQIYCAGIPTRLPIPENKIKLKGHLGEVKESGDTGKKIQRHNTAKLGILGEHLCTAAGQVRSPQLSIAKKQLWNPKTVIITKFLLLLCWPVHMEYKTQLLFC